MTDKQEELMKKEKAILKILNSLDFAERQTVAMLVYQLTEAEDRVRNKAEQEALAKEKLAYMDKPYMINDPPTSSGAAIGMPQTEPGGLFRG